MSDLAKALNEALSQLSILLEAADEKSGYLSPEEKNWQNPDTYHSQEVNHIPQIPGKAANAVCHNLFPDDSVLPSKEGDGLNKSSLVICNPEMDNTRML